MLKQLNIHKQKSKDNFNLNLPPYKNQLKIYYRTKCKTVKLLGANIIVNNRDLELRKDFLDMAQKA